MKTAIASALAAALLTGCITVAPNEPELSGTRWSFASIDGAAPVSPRASLEFLPDRISATAGCNGLGGRWEARDGRLITGPFVSTMMYCEGLMEQQRAIAQTIDAKPAYSLSGDRLTLTGGGHTLVLRRAG